MGFVNKLLPTVKGSDAPILILGATEKAISTRLKFAATMIEEGDVNPKKIFLVSGERDLWPKCNGTDIYGEDSTLDLVVTRIKEKIPDIHPSIRSYIKDIISDKFKGLSNKEGLRVTEARASIVREVERRYKITWPTEADLMLEMSHKLLSEQVPKDIILLVSAPKLKEGKRPNTQSTLKYMTEKHTYLLSSENLVVVTSQPYARYQQGVVKDVFVDREVKMAAPPIDDTSGLTLPVLIEVFLSSIYSWKQVASRSLEKNSAGLNQVEDVPPTNCMGVTSCHALSEAHLQTNMSSL